MTLTMFDTVTPSAVPSNPQAVAGYVGGSFPDYTELVAMFPHAHHLSIAPQAYMNAECLDDEPGDANNSQVVGWYRKAKTHAVKRPVFYTSASNVQTMVDTLSAAGIPRVAYYVWSAHYTYSPHICGPHTCGYPQADLTQFTDHALGRNLDQSVVSDYVFVAPKPPVPKPVRQPWQPVTEFNWCVKWDNPKLSKTARTVLKLQMTVCANMIWALAHTTNKLKNGKPNWRYRNRGLRFHALWKRVHPTKPKLKTSGK